MFLLFLYHRDCYSIKLPLKVYYTIMETFLHMVGISIYPTLIVYKYIITKFVHTFSYTSRYQITQTNSHGYTTLILPPLPRLKNPLDMNLSLQSLLRCKSATTRKRTRDNTAASSSAVAASVTKILTAAGTNTAAVVFTTQRNNTVTPYPAVPGCTDSKTAKAHGVKETQTQLLMLKDTFLLSSLRDFRRS